MLDCIRDTAADELGELCAEVASDDDKLGAAEKATAVVEGNAGDTTVADTERLVDGNGLTRAVLAPDCEGV